MSGEKGNITFPPSFEKKLGPLREAAKRRGDNRTDMEHIRDGAKLLEEHGCFDGKNKSKT